jgi:redox-sensitive bicupin YhaK (pirin superfamily)
VKNLAYIKTQDAGHWVGDGFPVRSIFSYHDQRPELAPFLLLDYAGPMRFSPSIHRRGVGAHPHRGFETVTIVYSGEVEHRDSAGGGGIIGPADVQWMTAGRGIVHEEYHGPDFSRRGGDFEVIQLWVNLPAEAKMVAPAYQPITAAAIPRIDLAGEAGFVRVIAGEYEGHRGPARSFTPMNVWDVRLKAGTRAELRLPDGFTTSAFVLRGKIGMAAGGETVGQAQLAVFGRRGDKIAVDALEDTTLLLLNAQPIDEPVVGYGPFVMNTEEEIREAIRDYQSGRMGRIAPRA